MSSLIKLTAYRKVDGTHNCKIECNKNDPNASIFEISYPGMPIVTSTIQMNNLFEAEWVIRALHRTFHAGKNEAKRELHSWLTNYNDLK